MTLRKATLYGAVSGLALVTAMPAVQAQQMVLEEIVVTARKRSETLQEVPLSVTAFTDASIESAGLESITDIAALTPNLSYQQSFGRHFDRPTIRGQSNILGEANSGNFIDGVFVDGSLFAQELDNLQRVEVIRGPQAALYGRATFAGAINYITKDPGDEFEGKVSLTGATRDHYEGSLSMGGPIIEGKLGAFVSARYYSRDTQYKNLDNGTGGPGTGAGAQRSAGATLKLVFTPTDNLEVKARVSFSDDRDDETSNRLVGSDFINCFQPGGGYICGQIPIFDHVRLSFADFPDGFIGIDRQTWRSLLTVTYDMGGYTLTSNSAYNDENFFRQTDADFDGRTAFFGFLNQKVDIDRRDYSQELRLNSPQDERLRWMLGGYYFDLKRKEDRTTFSLFGVSGEDVPPFTVENYAVFGSLEYDFTDQLTVTVEGRRAWDKLATSGTSTVANLSRSFVLEETFKSWAPRVIATYDMNEQTNLYASVAKGNKPGGFNDGLQDADVPDSERARLAAFIAFEEEKSWNYEIGAKNTFMDGQMIFNVSAFYIDWTNQQLTASVPLTTIAPNGDILDDSASLIQNAGKTEVKGIEIETSWQVNENLTLQGTYGFIDAEFKEFDDLTNQTLTGELSVAGNEPPNAPDHTLSLASTLRFPIWRDFEWFGRAEFTLETSRWTQVHNLLETGDTTRVNLRTGIENDQWSLTAYVNNLNQDRSATVITRFFDPFGPFRGFVAQYPDKRQFGLKATARF